MKRKSLFLAALLSLGSFYSFAQNNVGIGTNTPNPNAVLDMQSTTQGVLVPRLTTAQRIAIAAPSEGLMVYDIDVNCFFFYESSSAAWQNLCSGGAAGPQGPAGPPGPAGAPGTPGTNGTNGAPGPQGPIGPAGPAGTNGTNGVDGATGPQGPIGPAGPAGTNGIDGAAGAPGPAGPAGANGTNGVDGATGPQGPIGPAGPAGANGTNGTNGAAGATGPAGPTGPQGPSGIINKYHVYSSSARTGVNSTALTLQPGMTQSFTLAGSSSVAIWATIGALNTTLTTTGYSTVDMVIYIDGAPLANGGWNRMFITNTSATTGLGNCAINTMVTLAAGLHTIELRTCRSSGTSLVNIGGNPALEVNPGELTIMILN